MRMRTGFFFALAATLVGGDVGATPLAPSVFIADQGVTLSLGNIDLRSYDGAGYDNIDTVSKIQPLSFLEYSAFNAEPAGVEYEMFFLSSVAAYKDQNEFGLMRDDGTFVSSVKGSSALGTSAKYTQAPNQKLQFGFKSPEATFYTEASQNVDKQTHMIGVKSLQDALLTIPRADLQGNSYSFNLQAGDIIFFIEDMLAASGFRNLGGSDFDYNDFLVVVRAKAIPEPATVVLLGAGSLLALRRRKWA